ncbi:MAG: hypothetical protein HYY49_01455 [Ignavibacteriales bacterium]|nr:hypothetical protein [Ignavibacteriales bacterium]
MAYVLSRQSFSNDVLPYLDSAPAVLMKEGSWTQLSLIVGLQYPIVGSSSQRK